MKIKNWKLSTFLCSAVLVLSLSVCLSAADQPEIKKINSGDSLETMRGKIASNGWSFTVGHNKIYDLSAEEKAKLLTRRSVPKSDWVRIKFANTPLAKVIGKQETPSSLDWRDYEGHAYIGGVKNQGSCGSCYSFGASACAEGTYNVTAGKYDGDAVAFSESYIAWCLGSLSPYNEHFGGCNGADYDYYELLCLTKKGEYPEYDGAILLEDCPYSETALNPQEYLGKFTLYQFEEWGRVYPASFDETTDAIKTAIMTYGVVDAAVYVGDAFTAYTSGVYEDTNTTPTADPYYYETTNHAIALVGWDDNPSEGGGGCWILRNSWGSSWGENGYMRIRYKSAAVNCAVCYLVYKVDDDDDGGDTPELPAEPQIALSANSCYFTCERGDTATNQTFTIHNAGLGILNYQITCGSGMVSVDPTSGTLSNTISDQGEVYYGKNTITISIDSQGYPIGTYSCKIYITDDNASNSPQEVTVSLAIEGVSYAVGNGTQFTIERGNGSQKTAIFTKKPKVYLLYGGKKTPVKVLTKKYPAGSILCQLTKKAVQGTYSLYTLSRETNASPELISDNFVVKGPEIASCTKDSTMTITGKYFGEKKLKAYIVYTNSKNKSKKLRLKISSNTYDSATELYTLRIKMNTKVRAVSSGQVVVENSFGKDSVTLNSE